LSSTLKRVLLIGLPVFLAIVVGGHLLKEHIRTRAEQVLRDLGFTNPSINGSVISHGVAALGPITFDKDDFSKIGMLRIDMPVGQFLFQSSFQDLIVDDMNLTGDIGSGQGLDITGWQLQRAPLITHMTSMQPFDMHFDTITLNSGQLDIATPYGALRIQAKGHIERDDKNKAYKLQGALWSVQHQLQADTAWDGTFADDGKWELNFTLNDSRMEFSKLQGSRMSGWLSLKRDSPAPGFPVLGGQVDVGKLGIGKLVFSDVTLTADSPLDSAHIVMSGKVPSYPGMTVSVDAKETAKGPVIDSAVETQSQADLLSFMRDVRDSRGEKQLDTSVLMPLLLTEGNLTRLEQQLRTIRFASLVLEINGPLDDLTGKIVAKSTNKEGQPDNHIVSLDPGDVNRK
jgi:hypothetical protein